MKESMRSWPALCPEPFSIPIASLDKKIETENKIVKLEKRAHRAQANWGCSGDLTPQKRVAIEPRREMGKNDIAQCPDII